MYKITHSLLSSWQYATSEDAREGAFDDFLRTLRGEPFEPTEAMLKGRRFEEAVNRLVADGAPPIEDNDAVVDIAKIVQGGAPQVRGEKGLLINGQKFLLVGVADYLKAGTIYDIKRTSRYEYGKYQDSTQHPAYFELFPASAFVYLIFDGYRVYQETYYRADTPSIEQTIIQFIDFLRASDLMPDYIEHWSVSDEV